MQTKDACSQVRMEQVDEMHQRLLRQMQQMERSMLADKQTIQHLQAQLDESMQKLQEMTQICSDQEKILVDAEKYLENIKFQSSMLVVLINDLLDLAKLETMNFSFNDEYFSLNELISKAFDTVKYQAT